jgi:thiaminase/transcriptional activator TenA
MSLAESLRRESESIYQAIRHHPFVEGIARGDLPPRAAVFYVQQDVQYLTTYARTFALAISQADRVSNMKLLADRMTILFAGELTPHASLCRAAGVSFDEVTRVLPAQAPTAHHYAQHMIASAAHGILGETIAAALPCYWVYVDLGRDLMEAVRPDANHPFYDWINFYAGDAMREGLNELCQLLDESPQSTHGASARAQAPHVNI